MPTNGAQTPTKPHTGRKGRTIAMAIVYPSGAYAEGVYRGAAKFINRHPGAVLELTNAATMDVAQLKAQQVDGLVIQWSDPDVVAYYQEHGIQAVGVADFRDGGPQPTVISDNVAIGAMAAEHLLNRGLRSFAYCGVENTWYARRRHHGFARRLEEAGYDVPTLWTVGKPSDMGTRVSSEAVCEWLPQLKRPVGVMTQNDQCAAVVLEACETLRFDVPRDVAVIGVDNDENICETSRVTLSSVAVNAERVGFEAASLVYRMLDGESAAMQRIEVPPIGVECRESTAGMVMRDPVVSKALAMIGEGLDEPQTIEDLAAVLGVSRRHLDRRFRRTLGRTAAEELRRMRIEHAKRLLEATNKKILDVALTAGFGDAKRMNAAFHLTLGMSPTAYRLQVSPGGRT